MNGDHLRTLRMTENIRCRLKILAAARPLVGCSEENITYTVYEGLKVELADEILAEIDLQAAAREERLQAIGRPARAAVVEVTLSPKRRRA